MRLPFELGVITDEIDADLERALRVAGELGIRRVELNSLWGGNVIDLSAAEVERARGMIADAGASVVAVDPPAFKACVVDDLPIGGVAHSAVFQDHLDMVRRGAERAHQFGAGLVRVFSFRRRGITGLGNPSPRLPSGGPLPEEVLERIAEGLGIACQAAEAEAVTLGLENVRSCWGNSGENAARILARVNSPRLRAIWDPANAFVSGEDPLAGYEAVRPFLAHVHAKDAVVRDQKSGLTSWEAIGAGEVGCHAQFAALLRDGYRGVVSLETHWRLEGGSGEQATRASFAGMVRVMEAARDGRVTGGGWRGSGGGVPSEE
jgi:L-ribulose-5-phosphate 3-epimerase